MQSGFSGASSETYVTVKREKKEKMARGQKTISASQHTRLFAAKKEGKEEKMENKDRKEEATGKTQSCLFGEVLTQGITNPRINLRCRLSRAHHLFEEMVDAHCVRDEGVFTRYIGCCVSFGSD